MQLKKIFSSRPLNVKIHISFLVFSVLQKYGKNNKANLRDLIAATGLIILLKLESNCQLFSPCDLGIWWVTLKNYRAPLLCYVKLCASFQIHRWILTGVTVRKCSIRVKIGDFLSRVNLKFDGWHWKTIGHLFHTMLNFVHHFKAIGEFNLELQSRNAQFGSKSAIFVPCDLEIWRMTLKNNRVPLLWCFKLCVSFQTGVKVQKCSIWVKIDEIWQMTLKNNRASRLCYLKLCASFRSHRWIPTGVTVRKRPIWVKVDDFLAVWPWNLTDDLKNNRAPLL